MPFFKNCINIAKNKVSWGWFAFGLILVTYGPWAVWGRFYFLDNALIEPHPWRQTQTALTILQLFQGTATVWDYRSPLSGMLWNNVYEFPVYQWVVSQVMRLGLDLDVASRWVTLLSFGLTAFFSALFIREFFDRKVAAWFLLLYLVNPFGVVFSRVCLIDYFALAATLASVYGLVRLRDGNRDLLSWVLFGVGGGIASLAKINIWFFISVSVFAVLCFEWFSEKAKRSLWQWGALGILLCQLSVIALWNYHRATDLHSPADSYWLLGEWRHRLDLWRWKKILWTFTVRSLFYDWITIPFVVGSALLFKKTKPVFVIVFGVFLAHTIVFFQVQTFHDYYLIACMPYLFLVAAVGMSALCENPTKVKKSVIFLMLGLALFKFYKLKVYYSPLLHDYREDLVSIFKMKKKTDPADIVFWDAKQGRFEIATYSERKVGLSETYDSIGKTSERGEVYEPTVYVIESQNRKWMPLSRASKVWFNGESELPLYRVAEVGQFTFSTKHFLAVLNDNIPNAKVIPFQEEISSCGTTSPLFIMIPKNTKEVIVRGEKSKFDVIFPGDKKFLNLPADSDLGCRFKIFLVS